MRFRKFVILFAVVTYLVIGVFVSAHQNFSNGVRSGNEDLVSIAQLSAVLLWPPVALVDAVEIVEAFACSRAPSAFSARLLEIEEIFTRLIPQED